MLGTIADHHQFIEFLHIRLHGDIDIVPAFNWFHDGFKPDIGELQCVLCAVDREHVVPVDVGDRPVEGSLNDDRGARNARIRCFVDHLPANGKLRHSRGGKTDENKREQDFLYRYLHLLTY